MAHTAPRTPKQAAAIALMLEAARAEGAKVEYLCQQDGVELFSIEKGGKAMLAGVDRFGRPVD